MIQLRKTVKIYQIDQEVRDQIPNPIEIMQMEEVYLEWVVTICSEIKMVDL